MLTQPNFYGEVLSKNDITCGRNFLIILIIYLS